MGFTGGLRLGLGLSGGGRIVGGRSSFRRKKFCAVQQWASEGGVIAGPRTLQVGLSLKLGSHGLHLGIQIVHVVEQKSFGKHG